MTELRHVWFNFYDGSYRVLYDEANMKQTCSKYVL